MSGHKIKRCIGLFNSMIHCGEMHSPASERARQEAYEELDELEAKAAKWDDPQTQADLELAAAVKLAYEENGYDPKIESEKMVNHFNELKRGAE